MWPGDTVIEIASSARARASWAVRLLAQNDAAVAEPLFEDANTGSYIGQQMFSPVVRHLVRHGLT